MAQSCRDAIETSSWSVEPLLDRYLAGAPESPHPRGRHDPFEDILARSAFADMQRVEVTYNAEVSLTADALLGFHYSVSHVLSRLGPNRAQLEAATAAELEQLGLGPTARLTYPYKALVGTRDR